MNFNSGLSGHVNRASNQAVGQTQFARVVAKVKDGYQIAFGANQKGLLKSSQPFNPGTEVLVAAIGQINGIQAFELRFAG